MSVAYSIKRTSQFKRMYSKTSSPRFTHFQSQQQSIFQKVTFLAVVVCLQKPQPPYQKAQLLLTKTVQPNQSIHQTYPIEYQTCHKGNVFFYDIHQSDQKGHQPCQKGYRPSQKAYQPYQKHQLFRIFSLQKLAKQFILNLKTVSALHQSTCNQQLVTCNL